MHRSDRLASDDPRARAYLRRRRYVRACLGAAFVAAGAGAALLLAAAAHALAEPSGGLALGQWLEERIKALLGGLGALLPPKVIRVLVTDYPAHTVAAVGGLTALLRARAVARRLHDRFFDAVDPRVLRPVRRPRGLALDADRGAEALPWVEPAGARRIAWDALHAWAGAPPAAGPAVSWCVLVGRSGAGKTRTAHELARRLARRDLLGAPSRPLPAPEARARALRAARLSLGAVLRSAAGRWRDDDPWDAGELHPEVLGGAWHRLEGWRPRRPTLLLLDDPLTGETSRVLACLRKGAEDEDRPFRHAVRLLVVHQTVPADLGARREDGAWTARESGGRPPVGLPDDARFSEDEVARLARGMLGRRAAVLSGRASLASFVRETEGNPLLVELGLHWLRDRQPLAEMSRTALLRHRAGRVVEALERAGMPPGGILAAAAATVAGGGPRTAFEAFGILPSAERLAPAFPLDVPLGGGLPPVRPDLIGYAFARRVVEGAEPVPAADAGESARRIAEAAWRANPRGTLRTVARLATGEDPLAVALRAGPPSPWAGRRLDLALAYVEQAVLRGGALAPARRELARLTPGEAAEALETIAPFLAAPGGRGDAGMGCFAAALERALSDAALQADPGWVARALTETASALTEGFHRGLGPGTDWGAFVAPVRALVGRAASAATPPAAGAAGRAGTLTALLPALRALEDAVWQAWDHHAELTPVVQALESVPGLEPGDRARLGVRALAMQGARAEAWARADALEAGPGAADRTAVAEAWAAVSHALALDAGATAGEEVARLAERVAGLGPGADVARQEARIRMHAAFLGAGAPEADADGAARAADRITVLLDQHPHDPGIRQEQAFAYRFAAHGLAMRGDLDAARAIARRIDALAAQHPEDRRLLRARVSAWTSLGVALADAGAGEALARVAEAIDAMAEPYGGDRVIARDRFAVWERVLHALPEPDGASAAEMDAVAARLDEIAAALAGIPAIGTARVQAWVLVLDALAKAGTPAAADRADAVAAHVDGLCAASDPAPAVALLLVGAWRAVAAAHAGLGPEGSARAQAAAERVAALSASFAEDPDFLVETIRAWRHVARAHASADGGLGVGDARAVAERVDALVAAHPPSARLAAHRLDVWSQVAFGLLSDPDATRGGEAVVRVAHHVEGIGAAHPADRDVQAEIARVWWSAAKQFAYVHAGAGAHRCAEVVERLERLAARFPGDREFDLRVATAHALLAEAHSRRPLGEGKEAAEAAARAAERRAGGHAGDVAFANAAAHAWVTVAMAISKRVTPGHAALAHAVAEHVEALGRPYPLAADLRFTQVDAWRATAGVAANDWEGVPPDHVRAIGEHVDRIAAPFWSEERFRIFCAATWISVARAYASRGAVGDVQAIVARIGAQLAGSPNDPTCVELRAQAASCLALAHANTGPQGLDAAEAAARRVDALAEPFPAIREFARDRVWGWMAVVRAALEAGELRRAQESAWRMDACAEPIADDPSPMLERVRAWAWIVCALADEDPAGARQAREHLDQIAAPFAAIPAFQAHLEMARVCLGEGDGDIHPSSGDEDDGDR